MPSTSLKKPIYDALVRNGEEPNVVINRLALDYLETEYDADVEVDL